MAIKLDGSLIAIFFIFWFTFLILKKLYFEPYKKVLEERENIIKDRKEKEERAIEVYQRKADEIKRRLEETRSAVLAEVNELRKKAEEEKAIRLEALRRELSERREEYRRKIEEELHSSQEKIKGMAEWMAEEIERKLI